MSHLKRNFLRYLKGAGAGSMLISLIAHFLILGGATVWIVSEVKPTRKPNFQGGPANSAPAVSHPVKMSNTQPNLDTLTQRLTVDTASSDIALPDLPSLGEPGAPGPSLGGGLGGLGAGSGIGNLKAPVMPTFGFRDPVAAGSLVGTLYLLPSEQFKTNDDETKGFLAWFDTFKNAGWSDASLGRLKKAAQQLHNTQLVVPSVKASEAPKAFGVPPQDSKVRFFIRYQAKIIPPRSGKWRFVGYGDDLLIVRIDGKVVLESSTWARKNNKNAISGWMSKTDYKYSKHAEDTFAVGDWVQLNSAWPANIEIFLSEEPRTGDVSAVLLVEEEGATYEKTSTALPVLPIWTTAPNPSVASKKFTIPVAKDAPVWKIRK